jgi:hypothetical protein
VFITILNSGLCDADACARNSRLRRRELPYTPLETRVEIMPIEKSKTSAEPTPTRSERYIVRSKESTRTSLELIGNSRILRLASIALYRNKGRRRTADAKPATETA